MVKERSGDVRMPWPVARLLDCARYAKSPADRRDRHWYAWEASVRLSVAASPPQDPSPLASGTLASWTAAFTGDGHEHSHPILRRLVGRGRGEEDPPGSVTSAELLGALHCLRIMDFGPSFVDPSTVEEGSEELREALLVAWQEGIFWPPDWRLVRVEGGGTVSGLAVPILELEGSRPLLSELPRDHAPPARGAREVHLFAGGVWRRLEPWMAVVETGPGPEPELVPYFFHALREGAEYVEFDGGDVLRGAALERNAPGVAALAQFCFGPRPESAKQPAPRPPRRLGDFTTLARLGAGGMGVVHLARQESLGRLVALKTFPEHHDLSPTMRKRFDREIDVLARATHANVIRILCSGQEQGTPYFVMEYVPGTDLRPWIAERATPEGRRLPLDELARRALVRAAEQRPDLAELLPARAASAVPSDDDPWRALARLFADLARALHHLHGLGIVHRDLSSGNVMLAWPELRPVLMDFGLAALEGGPALTQSRGPLGTPPYVAPERLVLGQAAPRPTMDVYSLGVVAYEVSVGRLPFFTGGDLQSLLQSISLRSPLEASEAAPDIPSELAAILHQAIERDPDRRYPTALALAEDLERFAAGEPVKAPPRTLLRRWSGAWRRRRRAVLGYASAAALLAGTALVWGQRERRLGESTAQAEFAALNAQQVGTLQELQKLISREDLQGAQRLIEERILSSALPIDRRDSLLAAERSHGSALASLRPELAALLAETSRVLEAEAVFLGSTPRETLAALITAHDAAALSEHPRMQRSLWDLAALSSERGDFLLASGAWKALADVLRQRSFDDPGYLSAIDQWSYAVQRSSSPAEAESALRLAAAQSPRVRGGPSFPGPSRRLALFLASQGRLEEARELLVPVVRSLERRSDRGPQHPESLAARAEQAYVELGLDPSAAALAQVRELLAETSSLDPSATPWRVPLTFALVQALIDAGREDEGRREVERGLEQAAGPAEPSDEHQDPRVWADSAALRWMQGDLVGARADLARVLAIRERTLPQDHPDLQAARLNLASTLRELGDLEAALALQEQVLEVYGRVLPGDHPDLDLVRREVEATRQLSSRDPARGEGR